MIEDVPYPRDVRSMQWLSSSHLRIWMLENSMLSIHTLCAETWRSGVMVGIRYFQVGRIRDFNLDSYINNLLGLIACFISCNG